MPEPTDEELGLDPATMDTLDPNIRAELRNSRKLLRQQEADLEAATERAAQAEREAAFAKAGIPDTPLGQMFAKGYDGDASDPAAIKAAFDALGGTGTPPPAATPPAGEPTPPAPPQTGAEAALEQELAEQRRVAQVSATGQTDGSVDLGDALRSATNEAELLAIVAAAPADAGIIPVRIE